MRQEPTWKIILIAFLVMASVILNIWCLIHAKGEEEYIEAWILCQPDSFVNARENHSGKSEIVGRLECGDKVYTDGVVKKGFVHCVYTGFETGDAWVAKGYIVYEEPYYPLVKNTQIISNGRVAARKTIDGERRCWVKDGTKIKVYMMTDTWAVTNKGFIKTEYIDIGR